MAKILIIDDEDLVRLTLRQTLERLGHQVREANNGAVGVKMQAADPADLVVTDIIMPDQEGVETIIQLRQADPALKVIAMSGGGRTGATDYLECAKKYGAEQVFAKPFKRKEFVAAVERCLGTA